MEEVVGPVVVVGPRHPRLAFARGVVMVVGPGLSYCRGISPAAVAGGAAARVRWRSRAAQRSCAVGVNGEGQGHEAGVGEGRGPAAGGQGGRHGRRLGGVGQEGM